MSKKNKCKPLATDIDVDTIKLLTGLLSIIQSVESKDAIEEMGEEEDEEEATIDPLIDLLGAMKQGFKCPVGTPIFVAENAGSEIWHPRRVPADGEITWGRARLDINSIPGALWLPHTTDKRPACLAKKDLIIIRLIDGRTDLDKAKNYQWDKGLINEFALIQRFKD